MASSRTAQSGAPKTNRTFGKASRVHIGSSEELKTPGRAMATKITTNSRMSEITMKPMRKLPPQEPSSRPNADPYSLSDLDDDESKSKPQLAQPPQARKRKRSLAPSEPTPGKNRPSEAKTAGTARRSNTETSRPKAEVLKVETALKTPRRRASLSDAPETPKVQRRPTATSAKQSTPPRKHPRLIDALAAQKDGDSDSDSDSDGKKDIAVRHRPTPSRDLDEEIRSLLQPGTSMPIEGRSPAKTYTPRADITTKSTKIKYTYSQASRSMAPPSQSQSQNRVGTILEEPEDDSIPSSPLGPGPDAFDMSDASDAEEDKRLVIKSVHELRRAGANNRFSDELEDLLSRIGKPGPKPSSLRRNALLELSQKLQRKDFASQFRDHPDRDSITGTIGVEEDVISGFALSAVLVQFLSDRPAPHLLHKLAVEGVGSLLGRLLLISDDIDAIASLKQTNLSKHSRITLGDVKSRLLQTDLCSEQQVSNLSPRTLALKLLDILYQSSTWDASSMISAACLDEVSQAATEILREPGGSLQSDMDYTLLVSILEAQSNVAREMDQEIAWLRRQSSNARLSLQRTLQTWTSLSSKTRLAALKMAINVTNTRDGASAFDDRDLLLSIAQCIHGEIGTAHRAVEQLRLDNAAYESLLLVLGVMINIMEHCPTARSSVSSSSIEKLAALYAENRLAMSEADSEEKSKLSVAFGYLAVLLGYLCLSEPGLTVVRSIQNGQGVRKLLGSIRDFIDVYKSVDSKIHGLEWLVSELQTQLI